MITAVNQRIFSIHKCTRNHGEMRQSVPDCSSRPQQVSKRHHTQTGFTNALQITSTLQKEKPFSSKCFHSCLPTESQNDYDLRAD